MINRTSLGILAGLSLLPALGAQPARLRTPIDPAHTVVLKGTRHFRALPQYDLGPVDPERAIGGITLMLKQTPEQLAALEQLLEDQQNPASPHYHEWLTPGEFADRFGASPDDIARITTWLESMGLQVDLVANSRNWVVFSGSAARVQSAFRTGIHRYQLEVEEHYANADDLSVPAVLEPLVLGIRGLDDFKPKARAKVRPLPADPHFTGSGGGHLLAPGDIWTIYNTNPLLNRGINGAGQKIAVVGQTDVNLNDVRFFRKQFGLAANDPQVVLVPGSTDPGTSDDDVGEANLDLDWSGAVAPNATIVYVNSTNVYNSVQYAVDQNLAPVISMSYGYCEPKISSSPASSAAFFRSLAQQANASGITWLAASGDNGAADCDTGNSAKSGLAVDLPASVPEVTGVGGTEFNEGSGRFWNTTNNANGGSALSFIPEMAWNDSASRRSVIGTGGGASIFFTKPSWQTGPGVPNDGARDVPDVSFAASPDHDGYYFAINGVLQVVGGTSVATPVFAGMVSLLNQSLAAGGAKPGLGNINPTLYALAQSSPGIFHDVTVGGNTQPCTAGSPDCKNGSLGFATGAGYDQATGLGSLDANSLVTQWGSRPTSGNTTTSLTASSTNVLVSGSTVLTATVKAASGTATPAGPVSFTLNKVALGSANLAGSGGTATATLTVFGSQLAIGANVVIASYGGSSGFNASSGSVTLTAALPSANSAVVPSVAPNPVYQQKADADGYAWFFTVRLNEVAGVGTTLTDFNFNGTSFASQMEGFFGSASIPAHGTISASLRARNLKVPLSIPISFTGTDASGQKWTQQLSVPFFGQQLSASIALASAPTTVLQNPKASADCPYYQELNLQEQNGIGVQLTRFVAAGGDYTSSIADWFGSVRLAPLGTLQADICWTGITPPQTISYEVDGVDTAGNKISATASVVFRAAANSPGVLSVSKAGVPLAANASGSASGTIGVNVPGSQQWTVTVLPANQKTSWLVVSPLSGTGSTTVSLTASAAGLANGVYTATLVFQSLNTLPQFLDVPVVFTVGASPSVTITGLANGASFKKAFAPGMILSVFGTRLASGTAQASDLPLPLSMGGVSATVNGVPAPLYYVSATQLNIQVPYETPAGPAILGVSNNGQVATAAFTVDATAPGIFVSGTGALVPTSSARRGGGLAFFITGEGDVSPPVATGAPPVAGTDLAQLPKPLQTVTVTVGGVPASIAFVGIPFLVGVTQVNITVPANAPLGAQPVVVSVGGVASPAGSVTVSQ